MDFEKLIDPKIKQDTSDVGKQDMNLTDIVRNAQQTGMEITKGFVKAQGIIGNKVLEAVGHKMDTKHLEEEFETHRAVAKELRQQLANTQEDNNFIENLGIGVVAGLSQLSTNLPEMALNIGMGNLVGKAVAMSGVSKLGSAFLNMSGEVAENLTYQYLEKEHFFGEDFTSQDLKDTIGNTIAFSGTLQGIKFGVGKLIGDTLGESKVAVKNTDYEVESKNTSPKKIVDDIKANKKKKIKATGIIEDVEAVDNVKTYLGKTEADVEQLKLKDPATLTADELEIIKAKNEGNFDIDPKKAENLIKDELEVEGKIKKEVENNYEAVNEVAEEIELEPQVEAEIVFKEKNKTFNGVPEEQVLETKKKWELNLQIFAELEKAKEQLEIKKAEVKKMKNSAKKKKLLIQLETEEADLVKKFGEAEKGKITPEEKILVDKLTKDDFDVIEVQAKAPEVAKPEAPQPKIEIDPEKMAELETRAKETIAKINADEDLSPAQKERIIKKIERNVESAKKGGRNSKYKERNLDKIIREANGEVVPSVYVSNKVQEISFIQGMKTVAEALKSKGLVANRGTFRQLLNTHILNHYDNVLKKSKSFLLNSMNVAYGNRVMDFREVIRGIEDSGLKLKDLLLDETNASLSTLPEHLRGAVLSLKDSLNSLNENFKMFDKNFDLDLAIIGSNFSRNKFLGSFKNLPLPFDKKGFLDFKKLDKKLKRKMAEKFVNINFEAFEGEAEHIKRGNAHSFFNSLMAELEAGGLRGTSGKNSLRTTPFHNFNIINNAFDETKITKANLSKVLSNADYSEGSHGFANLIKGLSEAKALKDTFGYDLENFVNNSTGLKSNFEKIFGHAQSNAYINEIDGIANIFRKRMGLQPELNHPVLKAVDVLQSGLYFGIKPFQALKQIAEPVVSALHRSIAWENSLVSSPLILVKDIIGSVKNQKLMNTSEMYRTVASGSLEALEEIFQKIDDIDLKEASYGLWAVQKAVKSIDKAGDVLSLMAPFERYMEKISIASSLTTSKNLFARGFDDIIKGNYIKQTLENIGFSKVEFDIVSNVAKDLDVVDPASILKKLKGVDLQALSKTYGISEGEVKFMLVEKVSKLQEAIMQTGQSTKSNIIDNVNTTNLTMALLTKTNTFLKKSGLQSVRRVYDMFIGSARYHNAGSPVNANMVKNIAKLTIATPMFYYANAVSNSTRRILTTDDDIDKIIEEEFSLLTDKYGDMNDMEDILIKLAMSSPEALYLNPIVNSGFTASLVDTVLRDMKNGNPRGTIKKVKPQAVKFVENRILD